MNKELVLFLPSRNSPEKFDNVVKMLYDTCDNKDNFDVAAIIDNDQIEMYSDVLGKYPQIIPLHPPHGGALGRLRSNINKAQNDFVKSTDYYFNWCIVDDFWGLKQGWDSAIVSRKDVFDDGFFTMYTNNPMSRNLNALASQFRKAWHWRDGDKKPMVTDPVELIYHYHEMLPIYTKKWKLALNHFLELEDDQGGDHVFLNAALAHVLSIEHGYSRSIDSGACYEGLQDNYNAAKAVVGGLSRDEQYFKWARENNFSTVWPVAKIIADEIWQHYRDAMDEPRGIGKYNKL